jgi:hypothetical protein
VRGSVSRVLVVCVTSACSWAVERAGGFPCQMKGSHPRDGRFITPTQKAANDAPVICPTERLASTRVAFSLERATSGRTTATVGRTRSAFRRPETASAAWPWC